MFLLKAKTAFGDAVLASPPLILDVVWAEHFVDTKGYSEFCNSCIGVFVSYKAVPQSNSHDRLQSIFKAINLYNVLMPDSVTINMKHFVDNGVWWPELIPPYGPLVMPTPLLQEEKEKGSKKRGHDELVGEEKAVPAIDKTEDSSSQSKKTTLEE
ncbi:hypothetical protein CYMTET_47228 [Cymbomonas tetramitiformis]|uniref:Uncharacterized protein n=1 Tax=Cymbomonas tetramitiformis TaxID=36881 RepID=A0AAE0BUK2_9CHLO|nr:hypothetical protein CYMTET_47228 [Cymbomonas tetramitiformis]